MMLKLTGVGQYSSLFLKRGRDGLDKGHRASNAKHRCEATFIAVSRRTMTSVGLTSSSPAARRHFSIANGSLAAFIKVCATALTVIVCSSTVQAQEYFGSFQGELIVKVLGDGRRLELINPYSFTDPAGKLWPVPVGTIVDGASIPRVLWTPVGGPLEDIYRNASVIHDHFCDAKTEKWEDVHLVFYNGMRAKGVGPIKAKLMYAAVYAFGPRWIEGAKGNATQMISGQPILLEQAKTEILRFISENDPSIVEINELSKKLAEVKTIEQLEAILFANANCTPILSSEYSSISPNKTLVLCGLSAASKKQAAIKNLQTLSEHLKRLLKTQNLYLLPVIEEYAESQDPVKWEEVKEWSRNVNGLIKLGLRSALDAEQSGGQGSPPPQIEEILVLLSGRSVMISSILSGPQKSKIEMIKWLKEYRGLINRLSNQLIALEQHLSSIDS